VDLPEVEGQIAIDSGLQIGFSLSHCQGPFVRGRRVWLAPPFNHKRRALSNLKVRGSSRLLAD
jgi:hypothetical protein